MSENTDDSQERSEGGSPILRHQARERGFELATGDGESLQVIDAHLEKYIGTPTTVFHELISDLVHIDVHIVEPTPERNFYTLITTGMSDLPMTVPAGASASPYAELLICLPPDWKLPGAGDTGKDLPESYYWPIRWLKQLARLPHEYQTYLGWGHTIPNGDPAQPLADNTRFSGVVLLPPIRVPEEFLALEISPEKTVHFWAVIPLYPEEMDLKLKSGVEALYPGFDKNGISELVQLDRPSVGEQPLPRKKLFGLV